MRPAGDSTRSHIFLVFAIVFAGETIFSLPFHVTRYFRPAMLDGLALNNAALGDLFAVYGITAMLAYFPGGWIADRLQARTLMSVALAATGLGGLYLLSGPGYTGLALLYGYWGVTTILLFWSAMIKATRAYAGEHIQGLAFGILDGGRGLVAAALASLAVLVFSAALGGAAGGASGLEAVVAFYTAATFAAALLAWLVIPANAASGTAPAPRPGRSAESWHGPAVWLQAAIVLTAYCGYKGLDFYSLYGVEVMGMSQVEAAGYTASGAYIRPVAAIAAGLLADRIRASRVAALAFMLCLAAYAALASGAVVAAGYLIGTLAVTFAGVFALRGVYFALLAETGISTARTGTAVGMISVVGFTPDVFFAPLAGRLIDATPGVAGYQQLFALLAVISACGATAALWLWHRTNRDPRIAAA